jgi:hypothetical protein
MIPLFQDKDFHKGENHGGTGKRALQRDRLSDSMSDGLSGFCKLQEKER